MDAVDAVVVGGGVAGLSAAAALGRALRVRLLEREPLLASQASGRNAAIYRPLEHDHTSAELSRRSLALLAELDAGSEPLLRRCGLLLLDARQGEARALLQHARAQGVQAELLDAGALQQRAASLAGGEAVHGLWVPEGGVLDIHALNTALARAARARGVEIRTGCGVRALRLEHERVAGVELQDGSRVATALVVLAAGAFSEDLAAACGLPLGLRALRRHLVQLELPDRVVLAPEHPVVWRLDDELYYRPESGGALASACDQTAWAAHEPLAAEPAVLQALAGKLARSAPALGTAEVKRYWACLRTFAPDRELVVGLDGRVEGLCWLGGLGGRGMSVAPAAGELLAACVRGEHHPLAAQLAPTRLLAVPGR